MQDRAGDQQIRVDFGIERRGGTADADQRQDVLQQAADPGVVQPLGRGGDAKRGADGSIVHEGEDQGAQVRALEVVDVAEQFGLHLVDVELRRRDEVGGIDLACRRRSASWSA